MKFLFLYIAILSSTIFFGQEELFHKGEKLISELEIIEDLVHSKIDSLRARKKISGLKNNKYLIKAAQLHVNWMEENAKFSHVQNKSKTKTPQKRVRLVGGNDSFVGENIAYTLYNVELTNKKGKTYFNESYEDIANDLVLLWRNSKGHYKNIMTKGFKTTGIALALNFENKKIYAVQVFGGE